MNRLTKERLNEIKEIHGHFSIIQDLFAEIDALEMDLSNRESNVEDLTKVAESWMHDADRYRKERTRLQKGISVLWEEFQKSLFAPFFEQM